MKKISVLIAGLMASSIVFADGGVVTVSAPFTITGAAMCVPTGSPSFSFPTIDNQTDTTSFQANGGAKTLTLTNCPVGARVNLSATGNMNAFDGQQVVSTVGDSATGLIGVDLFASAADGQVGGSVVAASGADVTVSVANSVSMMATLKVKSAGGLKSVSAGSYNIAVPVTISVR